MRIKKVLLFALIAMVLLAFVTVVIYKTQPQMHKTIILEQIIFKKGK